MPSPISPGAALQALRPLLAKFCAHCGAGFTAKDPRAKFCSNRCRQAAKYQRVKESRLKLALPNRIP